MDLFDRLGEVLLVLFNSNLEVLQLNVLILLASLYLVNPVVEHFDLLLQDLSLAFLVGELVFHQCLVICHILFETLHLLKHDVVAALHLL